MRGIVAGWFLCYDESGLRIWERLGGVFFLMSYDVMRMRKKFGMAINGRCLERDK